MSTKTAVAFVAAAFGKGSPAALADEWAKVLDVVNVDLYKEYDADGKAQRDNVVSRAKYERLEEGGPKMGEISAKLVPPPLSFSPTLIATFVRSFAH